MRRCTYTEQSLYRDIARPMVSIHSLVGAPERDMPLVVVYENENGYVETEYRPVTQLLLANDSNKNTGKIEFSLETSQGGDVYIALPEITSFASVITKAPSIGRWTEDYAYLADEKYYFYTQDGNLAFADSNRLFDQQTPVREGEIQLNDFYNLNFIPLCDSALDYVIADDLENGGTKEVPCRHAFKKFEIDNVKPKELILLPVYYYPISRVSFEQKYPLDPPSLWLLKEQQDGNMVIKINVTYPNGETTRIMQINLQLNLNQYDYDIGWNYCVPKEENNE